MRRGVAAAVALAIFLSGASAVHADPPTPGQSGSLRGLRPDVVETIVEATDAGITIYVGIRSSSPGSPGSPVGTTLVHTPETPACTANATHIGHESAWASRGLREHPDTVPYAVNCDDGYFGIAWVPVGVPDDPTVVVEFIPGVPIDPLTVAESLLGLVPLPPTTVGANPDTGLVAMPSWYWIEGYAGEPLSGSETLGGTTVEVEITPDHYRWAFGDGHEVTTQSLGIPYPGESDIQHTYEQSSGVDGQFEVRLDIVFNARTRVTTVEDDGAGGTVTVVGDWQDLDPITRSFTRPYPVRQVQSVLTAGQ